MAFLTATLEYPDGEDIVATAVVYTEGDRFVLLVKSQDPRFTHTEALRMVQQLASLLKLDEAPPPAGETLN